VEDRVDEGPHRRRRDKLQFVAKELAEQVILPEGLGYVPLGEMDLDDDSVSALLQRFGGDRGETGLHRGRVVSARGEVLTHRLEGMEP
jgi:hypothetical protein